MSQNRIDWPGIGLPGPKRDAGRADPSVSGRPDAVRPSQRWLLGLLVCLALAACQRTPPVVKIGWVGPFEGRYRPIGYDTIYSARLAVREVNRQGGIANFRLALVALDDSGDPELARQAARALIVDQAVVLVVGHWLTDTTAAAAPLYAMDGLPLIAVGSGDLGPTPPDRLPVQFQRDYAGLTPFGETAGRFAGPAYDAMTLAREALRQAAENGTISRAAVGAALPDLTVDGLTGPVSATAP